MAQTMIRLLDILSSFFGLLFLSPVLALLWAIGWLINGSPIFRQERLGKYQRSFVLLKFRTMHPNTASAATHLTNPASITRFGGFLRRTKLDELPQLWNVLVGDMCLVGPRPCLSGQKEVIDERRKRGVFNARPGITGLAQIREIDMSTPELLAKMDEEMLKNFTVVRYFYFIFLTVLGRGAGDRIGDSAVKNVSPVIVPKSERAEK